MSSGRLERLPWEELDDGLRVFRAESPRSRLLGLALVEEIAPTDALLIPRCRSVHTFGMRFPIDVVFLDGAGAAAWVERSLPPRRVAGVLKAEAVLETPAGRADDFLRAGVGALAARLSRRPPVAAGGS